ncbi:MAG: Hint domain-containing protein [Rhodobacteraceae bacterium]|nr:Hint domain-containing protein [Paracoccaceae bacterium]
MPCFTPGITTVTADGERAIEDLRVGDRLVTRDGGLREVRWVGTRTFSYGEIQARPHLKPVLIRAGSLGPGRPEADMMLSPNTRVLAPRERSALHFDRREPLIAAKHLLSGAMIRVVEVLGVTYLHVLLDRHETVLANGLWTELFHPGDASLGARGNAQRNEIREIFPALREAVAADGAAPSAARARRENVLLDFTR